MKVLLIHTDGYSIDVVGKYNTKEEACKQLNFEYVSNLILNMNERLSIKKCFQTVLIRNG